MSDPRIDGNRATYDDIGAQYADVNRELPESVVESMDRFETGLPAHAVVADIGCGPGRDLAALRARGLRVLGFDVSLGMLVAGGHAGVVQADMTRLPIAASSLDGVWCAASFLHIPRELSASTLGGFARALRLGGALHLSVAEGVGEQIRQAKLGRRGDLLYIHHDEDGLTALLAGAGFEVRSVHRSESNRRWLTVGSRLVTRDPGGP